MPRRLVRAEEPEEPEEPDREEPEPLLYSAEAAARMLGGISVSMIYRYVQTKELHPVRLGSRSLFTMKELQRFIKEKQRE
jgi:predicted DNA-binding transcriptional regulator AlpA